MSTDSIMKEKLLYTVEKLREEGVDLKETPALFKWQYDEEPNVYFEMLITESDEVPESETVH